MKPSSAPGSAQVLVATDNADDAGQILRQLHDDFEEVRASTRAEQAASDFEECLPDVLVLAFDRLEKAQRYYLGLYRSSKAVHSHPHRTVLLCDKSEVHAAFALCKEGFFDDYVLYWPHSHDGPRLAMSIWLASRSSMSRSKEAPSAAELLAHARHLSELETTLAVGFAEGANRAAAAKGSLQDAEREIAGAIDRFSQRLGGGKQPGGVDVSDAAALAGAIDQLKTQQIAQARRVGAGNIESMGQWANELQQRIQPALAGTRAMADKARAIRPLVLVVEDDELTRRLVTLTLDPTVYEIQFVGDGSAALNLLRRVHPDAILMDIRLPGMDGVELTQRLKAVPRLADIPVIMMSGDARRETLVLSMEVGAAAFVVKPFTRESLTSKLEKFLPRVPAQPLAASSATMASPRRQTSTGNAGSLPAAAAAGRIATPLPR